MRIEGRGDHWVVLAQWHGAERVVHRGDIFSCLYFARDNKE